MKRYWRTFLLLNCQFGYRCRRRMLETKYVGDNFEMLVTVLTDFVTNILFLLPFTSGTNIQKISPISKFCHQHPKIVTNIKSPTFTCHQHLCSRQFQPVYFQLDNEEYMCKMSRRSCWPMTKILTSMRNEFKKSQTVLNNHNHKMTWDDIFCLLLILLLYIYYYEKIENAIERLF